MSRPATAPLHPTGCRIAATSAAGASTQRALAAAPPVRAGELVRTALVACLGAYWLPGQEAPTVADAT